MSEKKLEKKLKKKFDKTLELAKNGSNNVMAIAFNNEKFYVTGAGPDTITPTVAITYVNSEMLGYITSTDIKLPPKDKTVIYVIDTQDYNKKSLFINDNGKITKIDSNSDLDNEFYLLYWEYSMYSFLIYCLKDPITGELIFDCIFASTVVEVVNNRYLFTNLLPTTEKKNVQSLFINAINVTPTSNKEHLYE
ncbi:MAG: hypothetical protein ABS951_14340 [Solibacillus sp.]